MNALTQAFWMIKDGSADAVIVGGLDFNLNHKFLSGMEEKGVLVTDTDFIIKPETCVWPFDLSRQGTIMSDGGSAMVLMSEKFWLENRKEKEIEVYCEITGIGQTLN